MICSGKQTVIFSSSIFDLICRQLNHSRALKKSESKVLQITQNFRNRRKFERFDFKFEKKRKRIFYQEKLGFKNKLFIIGGGHCALALSELMAKMDFHISLFDDRPNLNTLDKNKFVHAKIKR
jgi:xanthine dehydrogenase accessory factor